jgi:hypothetical protein
MTTGTKAALELHPDADEFGAARTVGKKLVTYGPVTPTAGDKHRALRHLLRQAHTLGYVLEWNEGDRSYAVLDVYSADGIVQDFNIPSAKAFLWWYRKLGLRIESSEA